MTELPDVCQPKLLLGRNKLARKCFDWDAEIGMWVQDKSAPMPARFTLCLENIPEAFEERHALLCRAEAGGWSIINGAVPVVPLAPVPDGERSPESNKRARRVHDKHGADGEVAEEKTLVAAPMLPMIWDIDKLFIDMPGDVPPAIVCAQVIVAAMGGPFRGVRFSLHLSSSFALRPKAWSFRAIYWLSRPVSTKHAMVAMTLHPNDEGDLVPCYRKHGLARFNYGGKEYAVQFGVDGPGSDATGRPFRPDPAVWNPAQQVHLARPEFRGKGPLPYEGKRLLAWKVGAEVVEVPEGLEGRVLPGAGSLPTLAVSRVADGSFRVEDRSLYAVAADIGGEDSWHAPTGRLARLCNRYGVSREAGLAVYLARVAELQAAGNGRARDSHHVDGSEFLDLLAWWAAHEEPLPLSAFERIDPVSLTEGQDRMGEALDGFFKTAEEWRGRGEESQPAANSEDVAAAEPDAETIALWFSTPPALVLRATVGIGKSHVTADAVAGLLEDERVRLADEMGLAFDPAVARALGRIRGTRIAVFAPTFALAHEWVDRLSKKGVRVSLYHGATAPQADGKRACLRDVETLKAVHNARLSTEFLCTGCPFRSRCFYRSQDLTGDVVVFAGVHYLTNEPPASVLSATGGLWSFDYLVIDDIGVLDMLPEAVPFDLSPFSLLGDEVEGSPVRASVDRLNGLLSRLSGLDNSRLDGWPLVAEILREILRTADYVRRVPQGPDRQSARALSKVSARNNRVVHLKASLKAILRFLDNAGSGPMPTFHQGLGLDGKSVDMLLPPPRLARGWRDVPTLILDATADRDLTSILWRHAEWCDVSVQDGAGVKRVLVTGAKTGLGDLEKPEHALKIVRVVRALQAVHGDGFGAVLPQKIESMLLYDKRSAQPVLLHHGAARGVNVLRYAPAVASIGRRLPNSVHIARMASCIAASHVEHEIPRVRDGVAEMRNGDMLLVQGGGGYALSDAVAQGIVNQFAVGDPQQAQGRARAVRRGHNSPVKLYLMGAPVMGSVFDEVLNIDSVIADGERLVLFDLAEHIPAGLTTLHAARNWVASRLGRSREWSGALVKGRLSWFNHDTLLS